MDVLLADLKYCIERFQVVKTGDGDSSRLRKHSLPTCLASA